MVEVTNEIVQKLRCVICEGYLSCKPILIKRSGKSVCGRCSRTDEEMINSVRNEAYELIASMITFPCKYDKFGCTQKLTIHETQLHEGSCYFGLYICPVTVDSKPCSWIGHRIHIKDHFYREHHELVSDHPNTLKPDINLNSATTLLLNVHEFPFFVQIKCSRASGKIWYRVRFLGEPCLAGLFKYCLEMKSPCGAIMKSKRVHVTEKFSTDDCIEIDIEGLTRILGNYAHIFFQTRIAMKPITCKSCNASLKSAPIFKKENHYKCEHCMNKLKEQIQVNDPKNTRSPAADKLQVSTDDFKSKHASCIFLKRGKLTL